MICPACAANGIEVEEIPHRSWAVTVYLFCRACNWQRRYEFKNGSNFKAVIEQLRKSDTGEMCKC